MSPKYFSAHYARYLKFFNFSALLMIGIIFLSAYFLLGAKTPEARFLSAPAEVG